MIDATPDGTAADGRVCYHCVVSGRVQGVWFRGATREQAVRLGVSGYACNLADGRVEVLACGTPEAVAQLREWLRTGPSMARVSEVACQPRVYQPWSGFSVD
jgi:acylphosphatase